LSMHMGPSQRSDRSGSSPISSSNHISSPVLSSPIHSDSSENLDNKSKSSSPQIENNKETVSIDEPCDFSSVSMKNKQERANSSTNLKNSSKKRNPNHSTVKNSTKNLQNGEKVDERVYDPLPGEIGYDGNLYTCAVCSHIGEVVCCDSCPNVYHRGCLPAGQSLDILSFQTDDDLWHCPVCVEKGKVNRASKKSKGSEPKKRKFRRMKEVHGKRVVRGNDNLSPLSDAAVGDDLSPNKQEEEDAKSLASDCCSNRQNNGETKNGEDKKSFHQKLIDHQRMSSLADSSHINETKSVSSLASFKSNNLSISGRAKRQRKPNKKYLDESERKIEVFFGL